MKSITILDNNYLAWVEDLCTRYRTSQIKAAVKVNQEMLHFYWLLGKDITERGDENRYGSSFYAALSRDLKRLLPGATGLSERNIRYAQRFYNLYSDYILNLQQAAANSEPSTRSNNNTLSPRNLQQIVANLKESIYQIPWGHQMLLIDKFHNNPEKAVFYAGEIIKNGWSRDMLRNFIATDLFKRKGKALTNFKRTLPEITSDLAQELTKDPYNFAFTGITSRYNEKLLKDALLNNITQFLIDLGTGFAYVGREYRLQIGETEKFIDLLFYNLNLSAYVVIEVKIGKFDFADAGQLGGYVVACNHILRKENRDNPTIGILICKEKDNIVAQYALEASNLPLGISEYDLARLYPEKIEGTIPTLDELEKGILSDSNQDNDQ
ncbi:MAG: DUF1016 domain-containing protein [Bacteroidales bacterium]|nr:DUF1016 domain-containing protein [Bacteroidales bacterium]